MTVTTADNQISIDRGSKFSHCKAPASSILFIFPTDTGAQQFAIDKNILRFWIFRDTRRAKTSCRREVVQDKTRGVRI